MKITINKILVLFITAALVFFASGCAEPRYYHENHRHSDRYYHHHPHRARVDVEIHN